MTSSILPVIKSRGYWKVNVRPLRFEEDRISSLGELRELITKCTVRLRGWYYPFFDEKTLVLGSDWIGCGINWEAFKESWRMYLSGNFIHYFACREDWLKESRQSSYAGLGYEHGEILSVDGMLYSITEIYEFASRLVQHRVFDDRLYLSIELHKMQGRRLMSFRPFQITFQLRNHICRVNELSRIRKITVEDIVGKGQELALEHTLWFYERFGFYSPPKDILTEKQKKLLERRL